MAEDVLLAIQDIGFWVSVAQSLTSHAALSLRKVLLSGNGTINHG